MLNNQTVGPKPGLRGSFLRNKGNQSAAAGASKSKLLKPSLSEGAAQAMNGGQGEKPQSKLQKSRSGKGIRTSTSTGGKQHTCSFCPKSFSSPSKLLRHVRIHTGYVVCHAHLSG